MAVSVKSTGDGFSVTIKLPEIDNAIQFLKTKEALDAIAGAAAAVRGHILRSWDAGVGPEGKSLQTPKINDKYREEKVEATGRGKIDMTGFTRRKYARDASGRVKTKRTKVDGGFELTAKTVPVKSPYGGPGSLRRGFVVRKVSMVGTSPTAKLGFTFLQQNKAKGNYWHRPHFIDIGTRSKIIATKVFNRGMMAWIRNRRRDYESFDPGI